MNSNFYFILSFRIVNYIEQNYILKLVAYNQNNEIEKAEKIASSLKLIL
jgi:hypothetical protein